MQKYSKEFKREAIKLSDEIGAKKAAEDLGVKYYTMTTWRRNRAWYEKESPKKMSEQELIKRNRQLEKEIRELETANEILKDALGFFAKDRKK